MKTNISQKNILTGWQKKTVDDICYVFKGKGLSKSDLIKDGKNECILYGELFTTYNEIIENIKSKTDSDDSIKSLNGDILIPGSTTTKAIDLAKASAILKDNVLLGGDINILRKKEDIYDPVFLAYYLTHYKTKEIGSFGQGITIVHLYGRDIKKIDLILPPISEQKKIATILTSLDDEIKKVGEMIDKSEEMKKGVINHILNPNKIPKGWVRKKLEDVAEFENGKAHENNIVEDGKFIVINSKFISQDGNIIKRTDDGFKILNKNDIAIVMSDIPQGKALGKCFLVDEDNTYTLNQRIGCIRSRIFNSKYLFYFLNRNKYFLDFSNDTSQTNLKKQDILNCEVLLPPMKEQKRIAEILGAMDKKIEMYKKLKEKLLELKKGVSGDLLSGKVRVKIR